MIELLILTTARTTIAIAIAFSFSQYSYASTMLVRTAPMALIAQQEGAKEGTKAKPPGQVVGSDAAQKIIPTMDKNADLKISKSEAPQELKAYFPYIDTNSDGLIDVKEAEVMAQYQAKNEATNKPNVTQRPTPARMSANEVASSASVTAEQIVAEMDSNGDSTISRSEASEDLTLFFENYDVDNDGVISLLEAEAMATFVNNETPASINRAKKTSSSSTTPTTGGLGAKQLVAMIDSNRDGKVSLDEAPDELKANFNYFDSDGDGTINVDEAQKLLPHVTAAQLKRIRKNKSAKAKSDETMPANAASENSGSTSGGATAKGLMKQMDLNRDGKITKAEAPEQLKASFQYVDTNGDGGIDEAEAKKMADYINNNGKQ